MNTPLLDTTSLDALPLPTLVLDAELRILAASRAFEELLPDVEIAENEALEALFNARDRRGSRGFHRGLAKHREGLFQSEVRLGPDGVPCRVMMRPIDDGWVCSVQDLREQEQANAELARVKGGLQAVVSSMADGLMVFSPEGVLQEINESALRYFRFASAHGVLLNREALEGREMSELFEDHLAEIQRVIDRVREDPDRSETLPLRWGSRSLMLQFNPIFIPRRGYAGICVTARDLTEVEGLHARLQRVLDNVHQGLFTLDLEGRIGPERSAVVEEWFGDCPAGTSFATMLGTMDENASAVFALQWDQLSSGILPVDVCLCQFPTQVCRDEQTIEIRYSPIHDANDEVEGVLIVCTDISEQLAAKSAQKLQHESLRAFEALNKDRRGFLAFHRDAGQQVSRISEGPANDESEFRHELHTLKGNAGVLGLYELMRRCHALEEQLDADEDELDIHSVQEWWDALNEQMKNLLKDNSVVELEEDELVALEQSIRQLKPHHELLQRLLSWHQESARKRLEQLGERARVLATRLGKDDLTIQVDSDGTRLDPERWSPFWGALVHVVRNAVDHGIETPQRRVEAGKTPGGSLWLRAHQGADALVVEIEDDGAGIAWERVEAKVRKIGLPFQTPEQRVEALFADGVSSRDEVSEVSGRGVGTSAVARTVASLGGRVEVSSETGQGTTFRFLFPTEVRATA